MNGTTFIGTKILKGLKNILIKTVRGIQMVLNGIKSCLLFKIINKIWRFFSGLIRKRMNFLKIRRTIFVIGGKTANVLKVFEYHASLLTHKTKRFFRQLKKVSPVEMLFTMFKNGVVRILKFNKRHNHIFLPSAVALTCIGVIVFALNYFTIGINVYEIGRGHV